MKRPWQSKTLWANLVLGLASFASAWFPAIGNFVSPSSVGVVMGMVNMVLRMVTKDRIEMK